MNITSLDAPKKSHAQYWQDRSKTVLLCIDADPYDQRGFCVYRAKPIAAKDTRSLTRHKSFAFLETEEATQAALDEFAKQKGLLLVDEEELTRIEMTRGGLAMPAATQKGGV